MVSDPNTGSGSFTFDPSILYSSSNVTVGKFPYRPSVGNAFLTAGESVQFNSSSFTTHETTNNPNNDEKSSKPD